MNRETPQPGERWRHFKGGEYVVIAIAYPLSSPIDDFYPIQKKWIVYSRLEQAISANSLIFDTESSKVFVPIERGDRMTND